MRLSMNRPTAASLLTTICSSWPQVAFMYSSLVCSHAAGRCDDPTTVLSPSRDQNLAVSSTTAPEAFQGGEGELQPGMVVVAVLLLLLLKLPNPLPAWPPLLLLPPVSVAVWQGVVAKEGPDAA
jgi:hypothetical protein